MKGKSRQQLADVQPMIGNKVYKSSGKPFKSGNKVNTVIGVVDHAFTNHWAYIFAEDVSAVECFRVKKFIE